MARPSSQPVLPCSQHTSKVESVSMSGRYSARASLYSNSSYGTLGRGSSYADTGGRRGRRDHSADSAARSRYLSLHQGNDSINNYFIDYQYCFFYLKHSLLLPFFFIHFSQVLWEKILVNVTYAICVSNKFLLGYIICKL